MNYLDMAIKLETEGETFYLEQADKNSGSEIERVFRLLANEERKHRELLENLSKKLDYTIPETDSEIEFESIFRDEKDFKLETAVEPKQIDVYRLALQKEKESIELYQKMKEEASDEEEKALVDFLIKQEENHYRIFNNIVELLRKSEEWVESAEFGKRETY
ncbi:rubrerythrin [Soehngenia longivitae]|uniref:Rubrerythrin n=1 Tax=Soehngenia longivitae TaxID=2562294 RepID=A0A4Z0D4B3_9FIRM|nr:ferritin family protein [Soehngenia longivitae]TFZ39696.1 rubrerythrin [Soehngenia longivitae]